MRVTSSPNAFLARSFNFDAPRNIAYVTECSAQPRRRLKSVRVDETPGDYSVSVYYASLLHLSSPLFFFCQLFTFAPRFAAARYTRSVVSLPLVRANSRAKVLLLSFRRDARGAHPSRITEEDTRARDAGECPDKTVRVLGNKRAMHL